MPNIVHKFTEKFLIFQINSIKNIIMTEFYYILLIKKYYYVKINRTIKDRRII